MSKSKKGAAPSMPQAPATGGFNTLGAAIAEALHKPFANGIDAGEALATAQASMLLVAGRMRATIGAAYSETTGFPKWAGLDTALSEAGAAIAKIDIRKGLAKKFDAMYLAPNAPATAKTAKTQALSKAVGYSAFDFECLTPQAKAALGKDNPAKAEAVQDFSDMLNKNYSAAWGGMVTADNRDNGRATRSGRDKPVNVIDKVKNAKVTDLPNVIATLVEAGIEVAEDFKRLAALIVRLKLATIKKD